MGRTDDAVWPDQPNIPVDILRRVMAKIEFTPDCWLWTAGVASHGYGIFASGYAHRITYRIFVGPIPEGLHLDHLCRNRACCNPAHLEPVTSAENIARGVGASAINTAKSHCLMGHPLSGGNLYDAPQHGRQCKRCRADRQRDLTHRKRARMAGRDPDDGALPCDRCGRAHQPREHEVPCARCSRKTFDVHAVCATCRTKEASTWSA